MSESTVPLSHQSLQKAIRRLHHSLNTTQSSSKIGAKHYLTISQYDVLGVELLRLYPNQILFAIYDVRLPVT